jgi:FKBP-type peptidyl-prolyl cis-trans isomerase SlyD
MKIADQSVVRFNYTLHNEAGELLDHSADGTPLAYLHGFGNLIDGLERALEGRAAGEVFDVTVEAGDAYGEHQEDLVQEVPREMFDGVDTIEPGMAFEGETDDGPQSVRVVAVTDNTVTIDANHPLAGQRLLFHVEVVTVRPATAEELMHGHVHGEGGHHH